MKQSALLTFESSVFAIEPSEDEHTNPGIYGKALAYWFSEQLQSHGIRTGEPMPEDFGWCIPVLNEQLRLYAVCSNAEDVPNSWRVYVFAEGGLISRLFGTDKRAQSVAGLFVKLRVILQNTPHVRNLREEAA